MDWPICRHVERQAVRMHEMMMARDVDEGKLVRVAGGSAYAEARARCVRCPAARECLLWLDAGAPASAEPDFCPNLALFESCRKGA